MRTLVGTTAFLFCAGTFAQSAPPPQRIAANPPAQAKTHAPMGCKLVGTVKGTKLWAGDCADAAALRGPDPNPSSLPEQAGAAIPTGQKQ